MSIPNDGGQAFPQPITKDVFGSVVSTDQCFVGQSGMSLRDWFAGMALSGRLANSNLVRRKPGNRRAKDPAKRIADLKAFSEYQAWRAYQIADAMIAEREKGNSTC